MSTLKDILGRPGTRPQVIAVFGYGRRGGQRVRANSCDYK